MDKRPKEGPRQSYFKDINQRMGFTSYQIKENTACDREIRLHRQRSAFRN